MKMYYKLTFVLVICISLGECRRLPSNFPRCRRNDPELNNCFARAIEQVLNSLTKPIPEAGLPKVDPLEIPSVSFAAVTGAEILPPHVGLRNIKAYNVMGTKVQNATLKLGDKEIKIAVNLYSPWYKGETELQLTDEEPDGSRVSVVNVENVYGTVELTGEVYNKDDKSYIRITDVKVDGAPAKVTGEINIGENESLNQQISYLFNENWKPILKNLRKHQIGILKRFVIEAANDFFKRYSYNELFPVA